MKTGSIAEKNNWPPYLKSIYDHPNHSPMETNPFETEVEENPLDSFQTKADSDHTEAKEKNPLRVEDTPFMPSFLTELIHSIKNTLISIKNMSTLSAEKLNDAEFKKYFQMSVGEEIKKLDSVLNSLLNYIHINTPIVKSNTLSLILEEVLDANANQIQSKNIKIFKKCEKDLPETFIHDEQVRFILNSLFQYALLLTPPNGTIGFLIKAFEFHHGEPDKKIPPERNGGYIETAIGFMGGKQSPELLKDTAGKLADQNEEIPKLILQLVKEILHRNHGSMTYEFDPKKPRTLITLRLPIERRKVVYYEPITI